MFEFKGRVRETRLFLFVPKVFDEKPEHLLFAEHNGHFIGCADNGLLTMILEELPQKVVALTLDKNSQKNTLYCTTVFAKAFNEEIKTSKAFNEPESEGILFGKSMASAAKTPAFSSK